MDAFYLCNHNNSQLCVSRLKVLEPNSPPLHLCLKYCSLNHVLLSRIHHSCSHTCCCCCVHRSLCPTSKLHQSDNLLLQQSKLPWSQNHPHQFGSLRGSSLHLCLPQKLSRTCHSWTNAVTISSIQMHQDDFLVRYSQGCAHPLLRSASFSPETCLPQPQSVVLTGVLLSLSSWRYTLHETEQP